MILYWRHPASVHRSRGQYSFVVSEAEVIRYFFTWTATLYSTKEFVQAPVKNPCCSWSADRNSHVTGYRPCYQGVEARHSLVLLVDYRQWYVTASFSFHYCLETLNGIAIRWSVNVSKNATQLQISVIVTWSSLIPKFHFHLSFSYLNRLTFSAV